LEYSASFSMTLQKYRITRPTVALFLEGDHYVAHMVLDGCVVFVDPDALRQDGLVNVAWHEKNVQMFSQDIRARGKPLP